MIRTKKFENLPQITSISPSGKIVVTENGVDKVISFEDFSNLPATNDIWNNASTTFTAYEVNVTDIQSAADSKLLDLKVNTVSKFVVRKDGNLGIGVTNPAARLDISDTVLAGSGSLAGSALNLAQTWNTTGNPTAIKLNVTNTASGATSNLLDLQVGGSSRFTVDKDGVTTLFGAFNTCILKISQTGANQTNGFGPFGSNAILAYVNGTRAMLLGYAGGFTDFRLTAGHRFGWTSDLYSAAAVLDTILIRDGAANTLAMSNGVNPQAFRLYNTYTNATTFERLNIKWDTNVLKIGTEKGSSGGTARAMEFQTDSVSRMTISSDGNIGIGTINPSSKLDIISPSSYTGTMQSWIASGNSNYNLKLNMLNPGAVTYSFDLTNAGTLYSNNLVFDRGSVGIGTATPQNKLDINGDTRAGGWLHVDRTGGSLTSYLAFRARGASEPGNFGNAAGNGQAEINAVGVSGLVIGTNLTSPIILASGGSERMRILGSNGNVGIGTTNPQSNLEIYGASSTLTINTGENTTTAGLRFAHRESIYAEAQIKAGIFAPALGAYGLSTGLFFALNNLADNSNVSVSDSKLAILANGNVGIGTTTPRGPLDISSSNASGLWSYLQNTNSGSYSAFAVGNNISASRFVIYTLGSTYPSTGQYQANHTLMEAAGDLFFKANNHIFYSGNVGIGTTTPASKLDIVDTTLAGSGSLAGSILNLAQTWNTTGAPTAIKLNVTNTASGAASNLLDLQVGGVSQFKIDKSGSLTINSSSSAHASIVLGGYSLGNKPTISNGGQNGFAFLINTANQMGLNTSGNGGLTLANGIPLNWSSNSTVYMPTVDVSLIPDGAGQLALRNGVNPQTFRLYNTYTDATTFERLNIKWDTNVLKIGTEKGSSGGTARSMELQTDGTSRWSISTAGHLLAATDNTYDIGANGATRPRNVFIAGSLDVPGSIASPTVYAGPTGNATALTTPTNGIFRITNNSATDFNRLQFGGGTSSFPALKRSGAGLIVRLADDSANAALETAGLTVVGSASVSGHFSATTKSFLIPHPTKPDKKLQYACLEGPENGVYIRGKTNEPIILLPDYWSELVDADSITVTVTPIGKPQQLFVVSQNSTSVEIGNVDGLYNYLIFAERKDVNKLQTEI